MNISKLIWLTICKWILIELLRRIYWGKFTRWCFTKFFSIILSFDYFSKDNFLSLLRRCLWLVLLGGFLWQTYNSVSKYLKGHTSVTFQHHNPERQEFPSISICPLGTVPLLVESNETAGAPASNFSEAMRLKRKADYITFYKPAGRNEQ